MRLAMLSAVLPAALVIAACQPQTGDVAAIDPEPDYEALGMDDPDAPPTPDPDLSSVTLEALSRTAEAFTGAITLQALPRPGPNAAPRMKLSAAKGLTYETELAPGAAEQASLDWSAIFSTPINLDNPAPDAPSIDIHFIADESISPSAPNGGLCGAEPVFALAMATPIPMGDDSVVGLAAFKGTQWPPLDDSALCGAFTYAPPR
jgi:hypothetical protein